MTLSNKSIKMDYYKDFIKKLRELTLEDVYLLTEDITINLREYIKLLCQIKFVDGSYHTYYGEVKKVVSCFNRFYTETIDRVLKEADQYMNVFDKDEGLEMVENTISINILRQVEFGKEFLPVNSCEEKKSYEMIAKKFNTFMEKLYELRNKIESLDKKDKIEAFTKEHFNWAVKKTSDILDFAHTHISILLVENSHKIKISLEEILLRMSNNLRSVDQRRDSTLSDLLQHLYDKNKAFVVASRRIRRSSTETAEIKHSIKKLHQEVEQCRFYAQSRLIEETEYWREKAGEFAEITDTLDKLKEEYEYVLEQETIYDTLECAEFPEVNKEKWDQIGKSYKERKELLKEKLIEAGKVLITFFYVRGCDRVLYKDSIGMYIIDEYNHNNYYQNYGMGIYHLTCKGEFKEVEDKDIYYFDECGRYTLDENNEKVYRLAPCTAYCKLSEDMLIKKQYDTGYSDADGKNCKTPLINSLDGQILPDFQPMDIKNKLDTELVKYLWDTFGNILPDALHDVGIQRGKNPIHCLAHKLLKHKYSREPKDKIKKKLEAENYRAMVYQERHEVAVKEAKAWKGKQVTKRKPEESDDAADRAVYDAQVAAQQFIIDLNNYD